jgi:hypothetical protein
VNPFEGALRQLLADLGSVRRFALVGGIAVATRTRPRFTADIDLAIVVADDREAEDVVRQLQARGYQPTVVVEQEARGRLATVRLELPRTHDASVVADLLFASSGIEAEVVSAAELLEIYPGLIAPVATTGHLLALKVLALAPEREHDARDIGWLLLEATQLDLQEAQAALALIEQRGFNRGKDLAVEFRKLYDRFQESPWT